MLRTQSYIKTYETNEVKVGCKYYFGELCEGYPFADEVFSETEHDSGAVTIWNEDGLAQLVLFKVIEYNYTDYKDMVVKVTNIMGI